MISDAIADQTGVAGSGGSWSLVKNGAGTTVLTGTNAYSGGTTVNAGILQGNAAGLQGNIVNKASVVFDQTGSGTMPARCPALESYENWHWHRRANGTNTCTGTRQSRRRAAARLRGQSSSGSISGKRHDRE